MATAPAASAAITSPLSSMSPPQITGWRTAAQTRPITRGISPGRISTTSGWDAAALLDYGFAGWRLCRTAEGVELPELAVELGTAERVGTVCS